MNKMLIVLIEQDFDNTQAHRTAKGREQENRIDGIGGECCEVKSKDLCTLDVCSQQWQAA